jgi:tetratricopeptide (TPR) repeat protein
MSRNWENVMQRAFVIRPFGKKKDRQGNEIDFEHVSAELIVPALKAAGLGGGTTGEIIEAGNIREDMFGMILEADIVVCDMTIHNANVFYELGIRHALRKKRSVLIRGAPTSDEVSFDNLTDRYLVYDVDKPAAALQQLTDTLTATLASERTDSPIFKMLPTLPEVDPDKVAILPKDLAEEVERAKAARAAGWLRLLSQEVETRRFQWPALKIIGRAQWDMGDAEGARRTYQKLIGRDADDLEANNALANLHERQYRQEKRPELLAASDQAIKRVLANERVSWADRTEALSLMGRNAKTRWRMEFEAIQDIAGRRKAATNRQLIAAYDGYRRAYSGDLDHFWSGLAALQMCAIAKNLANEEQWEDSFDSEREARDKKEELTVAFDELKVAVKLAIQGAKERLTPDSNDRIWADISGADLLFVTEPKDSRVARAYKDSVPATPWFVGAAKGQLELFASLGIRPELAKAIVAELIDAAEPQSAARPPSAIVIVAGHLIDKPARAHARFPESAAPAVKERLREKLAALNRGADGIRVLASAAPGTDIICHELCREMGVKSTMCLPMPVDVYSTHTFKDLDGWRSRFLALVAAGVDRLQLSDTAGLPKWLNGTDTNEWERGNRWVLQLALSADAPKVSLIAVWDGSPTGDGKGGTAHMVDIARSAETVAVDVIKLEGMAVVDAGS